MAQISKVAGMLCILIFAMGILYQLGHFEKTAKVIRFIIAIYILLALLKSFNGAKGELMVLTEEINIQQHNYQDELKNEIVKQTQQQLEIVIKNRLDEKNIAYNEVSVHILEQNGTVEIKRIKIVCQNDCKNTVENCIQDLLTDNTKIVIGE